MAFMNRCPIVAQLVAEYAPDPRTTGAMACVSRLWRQAAASDRVWKRHFVRLYDAMQSRAHAFSNESDRQELDDWPTNGLRSGQWLNRYHHLARFCAWRSRIFIGSHFVSLNNDEDDKEQQETVVGEKKKDDDPADHIRTRVRNWNHILLPFNAWISKTRLNTPSIVYCMHLLPPTAIDVNMTKSKKACAQLDLSGTFGVHEPIDPNGPVSLHRRCRGAIAHATYRGADESDRIIFRLDDGTALFTFCRAEQVDKYSDRERTIVRAVLETRAYATIQRAAAVTSPVESVHKQMSEEETWCSDMSARLRLPRAVSSVRGHMSDMVRAQTSFLAATADLINQTTRIRTENKQLDIVKNALGSLRLPDVHKLQSQLMTSLNNDITIDYDSLHPESWIADLVRQMPAPPTMKLLDDPRPGFAVRDYITHHSQQISSAVPMFWSCVECHQRFTPGDVAFFAKICNSCRHCDVMTKSRSMMVYVCPTCTWRPSCFSMSSWNDLSKVVKNIYDGFGTWATRTAPPFPVPTELTKSILCRYLNAIASFET
jgi:hypothetical protein